MILSIFKPALGLPGQETIAVPLVMWLAGGLGAFQKERSCRVEWQNHCAVFHGSDFHMPVAGMRQRMKIAVIDERFQVDLQRSAGSRDGVMNKSRVFALDHPDAFFEQSIRQRISPNRSSALETEAFEKEKSLRIDDPAAPAVRRKRKSLSVITNGLFKKGY